MEMKMMLPAWFVRLIFRLLYNELAFTYELVAWLVSFGQWAAWRRTVMCYLREGPVLDLAHGTGGLMADLTQRGLTPVGLDLSPYMSRIARRRLVWRGLPFQLARGRAQQLPFRDACFANVLVTFPADFILDAETLVSIARVLSPEGRLVIVVMGYLRRIPLLRRLVDWAYSITTPRNPSEADAITRLREAGFDARWEEATVEGATARVVVGTRAKG
jgi:ubiquinone/menaquinone biosynthesis C-methylase UbiE